MNKPQEPPAPVEPPELIVDLDHQDLVTAQLREYELWPKVVGDDKELIDPSPELGLARLTLPAGVVELDALLIELRRHFAGLFGGWIPVVGKNRTIEGIIGSGTSKPMVGGLVSLGTSKPMLLDEPELTPGRAVSVAPSDVGTGVTIGLIDTPFRKSAGLPGPHTVDAEPALELPAEPVPARAGHGIFVASKILERAPGAHLIVSGLLDPMTGRGDTWTIAKEMLQLARRVHIMNLSFGSYTADGEPPLVLTRATERIGPDVVVVAAAGNHGIVTGWQNGLTKRSAAWPAALPTVVAVGARREHDGLAEFTPRVPWITCTAPGEKVTGAYLTADVVIHDEFGTPGTKHFDGTALWSGTSFAAATVTGAIAARMTGGTSARAALTALLADPDPKAVVRNHNRVLG